MGDNKNIVRCSNCKALLNEAPSKQTPCPFCGSITALFELSINEGIVHHETIGMKARHGKGQKPFIEQKSGSELYRKTGKYNDRSMIVDIENDLYTEIIKNPETGEIVHKCIEPLSKHTEHGDAKKKKI